MSSLALSAYRCGTMLLGPVAPLGLRLRELRGKEDPHRWHERLGHPSAPRPNGQLVWIHGASVGECTSVLPLINQLLEQVNRHVLVTSGTVSSAALMAAQLPPGTIHQYAPLDIRRAIRRFLHHWRPDIGLFVDSEIWPNMLLMARSVGIPLMLVNGRMSARAFARWRRVPRMAAALLGCYAICLAQESETAERLLALGAAHVEVSGNLKADAAPLPADMACLSELSDAIGGRPILLAASTHPGEHETILPAHDLLKRGFPRLLTIIAPRHPARGGEIAMLCGERPVARRALKQVPDERTAVYVADTLGELGLFYRMTPFAFVGGSLIPHGGQNPLEPARLRCAVLAGPHTHNFAQAYDAILAAQGCGRVHSSGEIAELAYELLNDTERAKAMGEAAALAAASLGGAVARTRAIAEQLLNHAGA